MEPISKAIGVGFGLVGFSMVAILNFLKGYISAVRRAIEQKFKT